MTPHIEIERFFLHLMVRITIVGVALVTFFDLLFQNEAFSFDGPVDLMLLATALTSYFLFRFNYYRASVLVFTSVTVLIMILQSLVLRDVTNMSFSVILVIGFTYSILLKGKVKQIMHALTILALVSATTWQALHPEYYMQADIGEVATMGFTYLTLYAIITFSSGYLKTRYDAVHIELIKKNSELFEKANEIETQNEELTQSQQNLFELNLNLEKMVNERTEKIQRQNAMLIKYSYTNAHHLRGPVARVLGLISVAKLDPSIDLPYLFRKIEEQAFEIDVVVRKINEELDQD